MRLYYIVSDMLADIFYMQIIFSIIASITFKNHKNLHH